MLREVTYGVEDCFEDLIGRFLLVRPNNIEHTFQAKLSPIW